MDAVVPNAPPTTKELVSVWEDWADEPGPLLSWCYPRGDNVCQRPQRERESDNSLSEGIVFSGGGVMWPHAFQKWFISGIIKTYVVKYAILVHQPHGVFI